MSTKESSSCEKIFHKVEESSEWASGQTNEKVKCVLCVAAVVFFGATKDMLFEANMEIVGWRRKQQQKNARIKGQTQYLKIFISAIS